MLESGLGDEERTGQVDGDHALPVLVGHLGGRPVDGDPGVVYQDVEAAVLIDDVVHDAPTVVGQANVAFVQCAELVWILRRHGRPELLGALALAPVTGRNRCPLGGQELADRGPDTAGTAGHQGHPAADHARAGLPWQLRCRRGHGPGHTVFLLSLHGLLPLLVANGVWSVQRGNWCPRRYDVISTAS